jgi:hypothetical protein
MVSYSANTFRRSFRRSFRRRASSSVVHMGQAQWTCTCLASFPNHPRSMPLLLPGRKSAPKSPLKISTMRAASRDAVPLPPTGVCGLPSMASATTAPRRAAPLGCAALNPSACYDARPAARSLPTLTWRLLHHPGRVRLAWSASSAMVLHDACGSTPRHRLDPSRGCPPLVTI